MTHDTTQTQETREKQWKFRVDKDNFQSNDQLVTGRQILETAGKSPANKYLLVLSGQGQPREIGLDEKVDLSQPGIERFRSLVRECREGFSGRHHFELPPDDAYFLNKTGWQWEAVSEGGVMRLVIYGFKLPEGFDREEVDLVLRIEQTYPDTQIDMFYLHPHIALNSGRPIRALAQERFDAKSWQRWSRHRPDPRSWRPGIDGVETHLAYVTNCLNDEGSK